MDRSEMIEKRLNASSPLEIANIIKEIELYDKKESQEIFDEVYKQFDNGTSKVDSIVKPVVLSIVDGLLESRKEFRSLRKQGLTANRVWEECVNFSYDDKPNISVESSAYQEAKNIREESGFDGDITTLHNISDENFNSVKGRNAKEERQKENKDMLGNAHPNSCMKEYNKDTRKVIEDRNKMKEYQDEYFSKGKLPKDEYRGNHISKEESQVDHIIPLSRVHDQFYRNFALNTEDLKEISNQDANFAVIDRKFNASKSAQLNEEIEKFKGENISKVDKERMRDLSRKSQENINIKANECVFKTLVGQGNIEKLAGEDKKEINNKITKEYGDNLTREQRKDLQKEMENRLIINKQKDKAREVYSQISKNALSQTRDLSLGNFILFIIKPIFFEVKDIVIQGLETGICVKGKVKAIKFRFKRVWEYLCNNIISELLGLAREFVKMLINTIIEGMINLFIGFYKMVFKIVKEGIKIFTKAYKVIWGEEGKNKTSREKGDAVLKIIGFSISGLIGIGVEQILANIAGVPGWFRMVFATICSGIIAILFMNALDKMDLFSVKSEKRRLALEQIYNSRIRDTEAATKMMDSVAMDVLRKQEMAFNDIATKTRKSLEDNDFMTMNSEIEKMAEVLKIELPYGSSKEFIKAYDSNKELCLD